MNAEPEQQPVSPYAQKLLDGMKQAVAKVYAEARRDDAEVAIMRDGQVVWIKARELVTEQ
jgi:hypothetical protein